MKVARPRQEGSYQEFQNTRGFARPGQRRRGLDAAAHRPDDALTHLRGGSNGQGQDAA
jgi:hypothetical protein